ncbi:flagellar protein FliJ [Gracilibacillus boraciitolerans JCM 21714]|uniref:Flagellar FliJ protein n=1 Tax=Gracilibacillus boraciitolerans JCM 21714 TaxID=1298598 RepID=W4VFT7_9BACI|nr:flagellar export protein FliJ [Gracilibacillus boraciitolerans]GAE91629.1 flagellar protein FliJ [Gracilibacillus boraciitolerans JCM 21714]
MKQIEGYQKIRLLKDNDKKEAQFKYQEAAAEFEHYATNLYDLLKRKEEIEDSYKQSLHDKSQIETLQSYHQYLNFLTPNILNIQQKVEKARKKMNLLQERVTEQYIEVKKIEKLIDNKQAQFRQVEKKKDLMLMDELSIRKYSESKDR